MADAAVDVISRPASDANGQCYIDVDVLRAAGIEDFARYGGGSKPLTDIFVDE
ncbi:hypothetical protein [Mycobacterium sp. RTGN4]|uniref:hypothetical protein n=1 Tax=Mycobacterium sp. RTGN4 TaxID=3016523 RepID=UPI0039B06D74